MKIVERKGNSDIVVVGLHGLGDTAQQFSELADEIGPYSYYFLEAPIQHFSGYAWFLMEKKQEEQEKEIEKGIKLIDDFMKNVGHGKKVFMFGFSQGAVMAYRYALTRPKIFTGLAGLSGYIFEPEKFKRMIPKDSKNLPVLVVHGEFDHLVGDKYLCGDQIEKYLAGLAQVNTVILDMGHTINAEALNELSDFICEHIK